MHSAMGWCNDGYINQIVKLPKRGIHFVALAHIVGWVKRDTSAIYVGFAYLREPQKFEIASKLANPTILVADRRLNPTYDLSFRPTKWIPPLPKTGFKALRAGRTSKIESSKGGSAAGGLNGKGEETVIGVAHSLLDACFSYDVHLTKQPCFKTILEIFLWKI